MNVKLSAGGLMTALVAFAASADEWRVTTETERWRDASASVVAEDRGGASVMLDAGRTDQEMVGFGTALSELGWDALGVIGAEQRKAVMDELFSEAGGGFTVVRLPIGSSDFARSYYSYDDAPGDFAMERFSIARDETALLPFVREVQKRVPALKVWASPWCPPRWLKRTGCAASVPITDWYGPDTKLRNDCTADARMYEGEDGFVCDARHLDAYALYFRKYVDAYRAAGVPIWMVMPQNEPNSCQPYPSCAWRLRSLVDFVGRLGRALEGSGTEVYMGTIERNSLDWVTSALEDPVAGKYVKGAGFQWGGKYTAAAAHLRLPELPIVQSEQECGDGSNSWSYAWHSWDLMKQYVGHGAGTYMYWNIALMRNEPSTWGWYQNSLVSVDRATGRWSFTHDYAFFKHLSHFVRRGARRLVPQAGGYDDMLAFANPDGSTVVVLANPGKTPRTVTVRTGRTVRTVTLPPDSLSTLSIDGSAREPEAFPLRTQDMRMRDPFVVVDRIRRRYCLVSSYFKDRAGEGASYFGFLGRGVQIYESEDLVRWSRPRNVLEIPASADCREFWAPEIHRFRDKWYVFGTVNYGKNDGRGTWTFVADDLFGPYRPCSAGSVTPKDWHALDGTLWVEDGRPYMVFCHEWGQIGDGEVCLVAMNDALTGPAGEPKTLFKATDYTSSPVTKKEAPFVDHVTDGPFLYRSEKSGKLFMIWSNVIRDGSYADILCESASGRVAGPWVNHRVLFGKNGGHGMIFRKLDGRPALVLHRPNEVPDERPCFFDLEDDGDTLRIVASEEVSRSAVSEVGERNCREGDTP